MSARKTRNAAPRWCESAVVVTLREKFAEPAYAVLDHVRSHTGWGGQERTSDAVVMGLWPSRGVELWGIEIKSHRNDWLRELKDPAKAERMFRYFDRFFLVTGHEDVARREEIPEPWGWMVVNAKRNLVTRKTAPLNESAEPPSRRFLASLMRSVTERIDTTQRKRAFEAGYAKGFAEGQRRAPGVVNEHLTADHERLTRQVAEFERGFGVALRYAGDPHQIGLAVRAVLNGVGIDNVRRQLTNAALVADQAAATAREALEQLDVATRTSMEAAS